MADEGALKKGRKRCRFFLTQRGCRFGDKCQFGHFKEVATGGVLKNEESKIGEATNDVSPPSPATCPNSKTEKQSSEDRFSREITSEIQKAQMDAVEIHVVEEKKADIVKCKVKRRSRETLEKSKENLERRVSVDLAARGAITEPSVDTNNKVKGQTKMKRKPLCRYFMTKKGCSRGEACKFSHAKQHEKSMSLETKNIPLIEKIDIDTQRMEEEQSQRELQANLCENMEGACEKTKQIDHTEKSSASKLCQPKQTGPRQFVNKPIIATAAKLSSLDDLQLEKLRKTELKQIHRRFGGQGKLKVIKEEQDAVFEILFASSDPDWPFDVSEIVLWTQFDKEYPRKMFCCYLSEEQDLPPQLIRHVNDGIKKWITKQEETRQSKDTVELPFRPFLRWLDRNLEALFIEAGRKMKMLEEAKAAGFEFVPYHFMAGEKSQDVPLNSSKEVDKQVLNSENTEVEVETNITKNDSSENKPGLTKQDQYGLQSKKNNFEHQERSQVSGLYTTDSNKEQMQPRKAENNVITTSSHSELDDQNFLSDIKSSTLSAKDDNKENVNEDSVAANSDRRGTEIRLRGLELGENTSTVRTNCVTMTMECARCKGRADHQLVASRVQSVKCPRCFTSQSFAFRPAIVHPMSQVLGYFDLDGCHPFDLVLVDCEFILGCLNCSRETPIKGLCYGSTHNWCAHCHGKLSLHLESTRFHQLQPSAAKVGKPIVASADKPKKEPKTPSLKAGQSLPGNGICKHYKKSFRWLRFPCCGKCYPCDLCHDDSEDHEMKFATRMVCGFCSKEQPFSQSPCTGCKSSMTKAHSSHWEGGKGCRDKVHMSRGDDRKYKNTNKTVSRKTAAQSGAKQHKGKAQSK